MVIKFEILRMFQILQNQLFYQQKKNQQMGNFLMLELENLQKLMTL